ncbi:MAG TPA: aminopeptidase P family N-terminal domain-containing protein [Acidimicrobiia bacterium]
MGARIGPQPLARFGRLKDMEQDRRIRLANVELPDFGMPSTIPSLPASMYEQRLSELARRADEAGHDIVVVYADREHSANMSYLTGFDPRFEEALLIVEPDRDPILLVGNECVGIAKAAPLAMDVRLFPGLSLPGQPDPVGLDLTEALSDAGVARGTRVGAIGWKEMESADRLDLPAFVVDDLRQLTGDVDLVRNATRLLIDPADGMRVINEVEQLAYFEYAACQTSSGVRRLLLELEPGMSEQEAVQLLRWNGAPLSCHLMLTAGERARLGLLSPGDRAIERGDPLTVAFGIWGALNCRAGFVVASESQLPVDVSDYVDRLVAPYFGAIVEWYEALRVGQTGRVLWDIVARRLGDPFFGIFLNPGHQIHLDEWVNTPVRPNSEIELRSGMALQVDVIPATGTSYFTTNIEDGIALADRDLRERFARSYPDAWDRIQARRAFMRDVIGIDLHADVLPFSNIPAFLPPLLLDAGRAMTAA